MPSASVISFTFTFMSIPRGLLQRICFLDYRSMAYGK